MRRKKLTHVHCYNASIVYYSGLVYFKGGSLDFSQAVKFIPLGIVGAAVGAMLMKKLSNSLLKRIFGALMIIAGVRIFMK